MKSSIQWVQGIVLQVRDYGEKDRIVGLITPTYGKISTFAASSRNSQRRFQGGLDLFVKIEAEIQRPRDSSSGLWRLLQAKLINPNLSIRSDLKQFALAIYFSECLSGLVGEGDPQSELFEWWSETLEVMGNIPLTESLGVKLELKMLSLCGYGPQWNPCVQCEKPLTGNPLFFSFEKGGVCCQRCRKPELGRWISPRTLLCLQGEGEWPLEEIQNARRVLQAFISHILGREPKSQRIQEEIFCGPCKILSAIA